MTVPPPPSDRAGAHDDSAPEGPLPFERPVGSRVLRDVAGGGGFEIDAVGRRGAPGQRRTSRSRTVITWIVTIVLLLVTVAMQRPEVTPEGKIDKLVNGLDIPEPSMELRILSKLIAAGKSLNPGAVPVAPGGAGEAGAGGPPGMERSFQLMLDQTVGWTPPLPEGQAKPNLLTPQVAGDVVVQDAKMRRPAADRVRIAIVAGESIGTDALRGRLDALEPLLDEASPLRSDVALLRRLADAGSGDLQRIVDRLTTDEVSGFKERHGAFADLALERGDAAGKTRGNFAWRGTALLIFLLAFGAGLVLVLITGFVLLVIGIVQRVGGGLKARLPRMIEADEASAAWGVLFVETIAVFLASFLGVKVLVAGLDSLGVQEDVLRLAAMLGQWVTAFAILWPVARGMPFRAWRERVGLVAPRGVVREIGAGLVGYIALLPLFMVVAMIVALLMVAISQLTGNEPQPPMQNSILDGLSNPSPLFVILLITLATMWAPLVEETIFRGTLFRYWRVRAGLAVGALGSAAIFAALHGYMWMQLVLVGFLGIGFAIIREWRGSLVGCIAAHAAHNTIVSVLLFVLLTLAGD